MRRTTLKAFNPLLILPLVVFKKAAVWKLVETYGFPLVYRRLAEGVKYTMPEEQQGPILTAIKTSIRSPRLAFTVLNDSGVIQFAERYSKLIVEKSPVKVPRFMTSIAEVIVKDTGAGKWWAFLTSFKKK
jgi:hypothetical protein